MCYMSGVEKRCKVSLLCSNMNRGKSKVIEIDEDKYETPIKEEGYGSTSSQSEVDAYRIEQPVETWMSEDDNSDHSYCKLQEANNIFKAVYKEIMTIAFKEDYYIKALPALGSIEELQKVFRISPPSDVRLETTTETAIVPITARALCMNLMNLDSWHASMSHIFQYVDGNMPHNVFQDLKHEDPSILHVEMVNAEFHLPTPFAAVRKFSFLRFLKEIIPNELWAIIDVSEDYFLDIDNMTERKCRRRPSAVLIRARDDHSEIIWIENMEVPKQSQLQDDVYSGLINSDEAFSAKRWVNALLWNMKRFRSTFFMQEIKWGCPSYLSLLSLTTNMRMDFMKCLRESPDERDWTILTDHGMRIMQDATRRRHEACNMCGYTSVVSFRIQAKPQLVFQYLVKNNRQLQWLQLLDWEAKEIIRLAADDESNLITLHQRSTITKKDWQTEEYVLQEASWDGFCYLIISATMNQADVFSSLIARREVVDLKPSGFAIVPDGPESSLVTTSLQEDLLVRDTETGIRVQSYLTNRIISEIMEEMAGVLEAKS